MNKKGKLYWREVTQDFHEHRILVPFKIQKTWRLSHLDSNKLCTTIEHVLQCPLSFRCVVYTVRAQPFATYFGTHECFNNICMCRYSLRWSAFAMKNSHTQLFLSKKNPTRLFHCWRELNKYPKWKLDYVAYKWSLKNGGAMHRLSLIMKRKA
jgi:hypothetical protein